MFCKFPAVSGIWVYLPETKRTSAKTQQYNQYGVTPNGALTQPEYSQHANRLLTNII
jgi:hypothetical protein